MRRFLLLLAIGLAGTAFAALPSTGGWTAYVSWAVAGLGMGLGMPSVGVLLLDQSPEHRRGADSASLQISDVVGSALCVGFGGVLVAAAASGVLSLTTALLAAIAVFSGLALLGSLVAGRAAAPSAEPVRATTLATS